ncbi:MAG: Uma2 family endonuclease [Anaerolineae bacterium]|nr:Uma2 family endonuclease [Anaerolineae bacterium]
MLRRKKSQFTAEEYLAMETVAEYKSEFFRGEIFALAGGTLDHNGIALELAIELSPILGSKGCRVLNSDNRLFIQQSGLYTYPDVMVICGKIQLLERRKDTVTNPLLIIEVLSDSTRDYDRGAKFDLYKQLPSLQEYVLIESERARVECYRRTADDRWTIEAFDDLDALARFDSIGCEIPLRRIYHEVSWLD